MLTRSIEVAQRGLAQSKGRMTACVSLNVATAARACKLLGRLHSPLVAKQPSAIKQQRLVKNSQLPPRNSLRLGAPPGLRRSPRASRTTWIPGLFQEPAKTKTRSVLTTHCRASTAARTALCGASVRTFSAHLEKALSAPVACACSRMASRCSVSSGGTQAL